MIDVTVALRINRPVEEVFAYVADIANDPEWHTDVQEVRRTTDGPIGPGATWHVRVKPSMRVSEGITQLVDVEPNRRQVFRGEMGRMQPTVTHQLDPVDGATSFSRRVRFTLPGPMRLMEPLVRRMAKKRQGAFVSNLKRVLEGETPDRSA